MVLGGTSLLGGRGNLVATALAALFLTQLDQFVLALGVNFAVKTLVQAAAFAIGVALYTIDWAGSAPTDSHAARAPPPQRPESARPAVCPSVASPRSTTASSRDRKVHPHVPTHHHPPPAGGHRVPSRCC